MMTLNQPRQSETSVGLHTTAQWSSVARISKQRHYADLGHRSHIAIRIVYTEQTNQLRICAFCTMRNVCHLKCSSWDS